MAPTTSDADTVLPAARAVGADFTTIVHRYKPLVFRWAYGLVGDADEAEDLVQETFVRVYDHLDSYGARGSFEGWLYRIMSHVVAASRRSLRRRAQLGAPYAAARATDVYLTDPGARVDRERAHEIVAAAVARLPLRQRMVFDLCELQERTPAEVAEMLCLKSVSVRASLFKARAAVRRFILATHPNFRSTDDVR